MNPQEILKLIQDQGIEFVDFKFCDFVSTWQHFSVPSDQLKESSFEDGFGFDGSSIRGWQVINESDMLMLPDPKSAFVDPFTKAATLSLTCTIIDPVTREPYSRDPRNVAQKAEEYLRSTGLADTVYCGPEVEFFIFDGVASSRKLIAPLYRGFGRGHLELRPHGDPQPGPTNPGTRRAISRARPPTRFRTFGATWS